MTVLIERKLATKTTKIYQPAPEMIMSASQNGDYKHVRLSDFVDPTSLWRVAYAYALDGEVILNDGVQSWNPSKVLRKEQLTSKGYLTHFNGDIEWRLEYADRQIAILPAEFLTDEKRVKLLGDSLYYAKQQEEFFRLLEKLKKAWPRSRASKVGSLRRTLRRKTLDLDDWIGADGVIKIPQYMRESFAEFHGVDGYQYSERTAIEISRRKPLRQRSRVGWLRKYLNNNLHINLDDWIEGGVLRIPENKRQGLQKYLSLDGYQYGERTAREISTRKALREGHGQERSNGNQSGTYTVTGKTDRNQGFSSLPLWHWNDRPPKDIELFPGEIPSTRIIYTDIDTTPKAELGAGNHRDSTLEEINPETVAPVVSGKEQDLEVLEEQGVTHTALLPEEYVVFQPKGSGSPTSELEKPSISLRPALKDDPRAQRRIRKWKRRARRAEQLERLLIFLHLKRPDRKSNVKQLSTVVQADSRPLLAE